MNPLILCYVDGHWAYFTTQPLADQWGDDWNDAPYEHNAGPPYTFDQSDKGKGKKPWQIVKVAWDGDLESPSDLCDNSRYSVEQINAGCVPWLASSRYLSSPMITIQAGVTLDEFKEKVAAGGGGVYLRECDIESDEGVERRKVTYRLKLPPGD